FGLGDGDFLVLGVGRLVQQKRPFLFLSIAKELHGRVPSTRFLWVGDGPLADQWQKTLKEERLQGVISCVGWQSDVLPYLAAGDLLLHVAEFEGLPFVLIEAMAAGLPCAVAREFASEISFFNEDNVLFVEDVGKLAERLKNPAALADLANGGRRLAENNLSLAKMIDSYEHLYVALTAQRRT